MPGLIITAVKLGVIWRGDVKHKGKECVGGRYECFPNEFFPNAVSPQTHYPKHIFTKKIGARLVCDLKK